VAITNARVSPKNKRSTGEGGPLGGVFSNSSRGVGIPLQVGLWLYTVWHGHVDGERKLFSNQMENPGDLAVDLPRLLSGKKPGDNCCGRSYGGANKGADQEYIPTLVLALQDSVLKWRVASLVAMEQTALSV